MSLVHSKCLGTLLDAREKTKGSFHLSCCHVNCSYSTLWHRKRSTGRLCLNVDFDDDPSVRLGDHHAENRQEEKLSDWKSRRSKKDSSSNV